MVEWRSLTYVENVNDGFARKKYLKQHPPNENGKKKIEENPDCSHWKLLQRENGFHIASFHRRPVIGVYHITTGRLCVLCM